MAYNDDIEDMIGESFIKTRDIIEKNSFIVFFNNETKEVRIIEHENRPWYSDFIYNENNPLNTLLAPLNINFIKFIHFDRSALNKIKNNILQQQYETIKDIYDEISEYCSRLNDISSIESIKNVLFENFEISNERKETIQFTNIYNSLIEIIKKNNREEFNDEKAKEIKYILPYLFENIGMRKKRTSKGMMWYGIREKNKNNNFENLKNKLMKMNMKVEMGSGLMCS